MKKFINYIDLFKNENNSDLISTIKEGYMEIFESIDNVKYLYHATYEQALDGIAQFGLGSHKAKKKYAYNPYDDQMTSSDHVYLAENHEDALSYAEDASNIPDEWKQNIVLLRVDVKKLNKANLKEDPNLDEQSGTYLYNGIIPQKHLAIIDL